MVRWGYLFFAMFLYPSLKGLFIYVIGKSEETRKRRKEKIDALPKEKRIINSSSRIFIIVIPYFGAFFYADFKYVWLLLGLIYVFTAIVTLAAALGSESLKHKDPELYKKAEKQSKEELKDVDFWPKWQVHALCLFNVSILILWLYSWRYLFA